MIDIWIPTELEMEEALLGAILVAPLKNASIMSGVVRAIKPEMFSHPLHIHMMGAILALYQDGMTVPDMLAVRRKMTGAGPREAEDAILRCCEKILEAACSHHNWAHYAGIVRESWQRREIISRLERLWKLTPDKPIPELFREIDALTKRLDLGPNGRVSIEDVVLDDAVDCRGVKSGFALIDQSTITRGYPSSQMSVVVARSKAGKTSVMLQSLLANPDIRIAYVTLEMSARQLKRRMLRQMTGMSRAPSDLEGLQKWDDAISELAWRDVEFFEGSPGGVDSTVEDVCGRLIECHDRIPWGQVFVDYAGLLTTRERSDKEYRELQIISRSLVGLAQYLDCPVVVGSQTTVDGDTLRTKGGRRLEEDSGLVLEVHRKPEESSGKFRISLSRFGKSGIERNMKWSESLLRYEEMA